MDDLLEEIVHRNIVGAVLLDLNVAFDIISHSMLLEKRICYGFTPPAILKIESYLSNRTQRVFFNGSLPVTAVVGGRRGGPMRSVLSVHIDNLLS
jgi:hypothetical protein